MNIEFYAFDGTVAGRVISVGYSSNRAKYRRNWVRGQPPVPQVSVVYENYLTDESPTVYGGSLEDCLRRISLYINAKSMLLDGEETVWKY